MRSFRAYALQGTSSVTNIASLLALGLLVACSGSEPPFPSVVPGPSTSAEAESPLRLSATKRFLVDRVLDYRVWSGARAGFVALAARGEDVVYARTTGLRDIETEAPMELDTRFHLASMTKPITAVAALILIEEGRLDLDHEVARYIPSFGRLEVVDRVDGSGSATSVPLDRPLRVRHLLTFQSGIGGYAETEAPLDRIWRAPDIEIAGLGSLADRIDDIPSRPLYERPGERWRYGWSADVLARVVEVAAGESFDRFLARRIFEPLGMRHTSYPDEVDPEAPFATMVTHDESGHLVRDRQFEDYYGRGWTPGGGGLVSTGPDFLRFAMMLANGGKLGDTRILSEAMVREMTRLHVEEGVLVDMGLEGLGWGLGVCVVADASKTPMPAENGDYWWSGRFGTQFWIRPEERAVVVVMQQTERSEWSDLPVTPAIVQTLALP